MKIVRVEMELLKANCRGGRCSDKEWHEEVGRWICVRAEME